MITQDEHLSNLVRQAFQRENEVYQYQTNIDNYTNMLSSLPDNEWPVNLNSYQKTLIQDLPFHLSDEEVDAITKYQFRDRLRVLIRTEKAEQTKSKMVLETVKNQIVNDGNDYAALLAEYKAAESAKVVSA